MPLSDHEQRMLDQIESALYAEDPKFASSVRGGGLRAPSARRRLQGAALFVIGLAMLVCGVAFKATMIGSFPILSVFGFLVMFGGVVFAITGPPGDRRPRPLRVRAGRATAEAGQGRRAGRSPAGWKTGSAAASTNNAPITSGVANRLPHFLCADRLPTSPHSRLTWPFCAVGTGGFRGIRCRQSLVVGKWSQHLLAFGAKWGIVG